MVTTLAVGQHINFAFGVAIAIAVQHLMRASLTALACMTCLLVPRQNLPSKGQASIRV